VTELQLSRDALVMAKPAGAVCNMGCAYCYYLCKDDLFPARPRRMPDALLEKYVRERLELSGPTAVHFEWHGGEPTTLGIEFFRRAVQLQAQHRRPGQRITNGLQTNGLLVDDAWARFLAEERFSVGLSLDGPRAMHDAYRVTRGGAPTHRQVVQALRLLQRHGAMVNILCVVHTANVQWPLEVYRFFREHDVRLLQFLPLVERVGARGVSARTASAEGYGDFMCAVLDEWARNDVGRIWVQTFDEAMRPWYGVDHALCIFRETCGDVLVLEHDGSLFACDHFVDSEHLLGNLGDVPLGELLDRPARTEFGRAKRDLPRRCRACDVLPSCNGGCPKDRFLATDDGEEGLNYLCAGFQKLFRHGRPVFARLGELVDTGQPLQGVMTEIRTARARAVGAAGRNDPCPCGSGRKFKKCCMGRA
jgi:uncharacterized protein